MPTSQVLSAQQSDLTISTSGTYTGLHINGTLTITASNVTVQRSLIKSGGFNVLFVAAGVTGVVIQDTEVVGGGTAGGISGQNGILVQGGGVTILRRNIHDIGLRRGLRLWLAHAAGQLHPRSQRLHQRHRRNPLQRDPVQRLVEPRCDPDRCTTRSTTTIRTRPDDIMR